MNSITLTEPQKVQLRGEMKHSRNVQVYRRAAALLALHEGQSVIQVAELLGVTRQSIYNWIAAYGRADENLNLQDAPRAGRPRLVTRELQGVLASAFRQTPAELGYATDIWTAKLLQQHLCTQYGRRFSDETLRRHLRLLGFVWKNRRYVFQAQDGSVASRPAAPDTPLVTSNLFGDCAPVDAFSRAQP